MLFRSQQVDPDLTMPIGAYIVEPGANVTFRASNVIRLQDGFTAKAGSTFKAHCPNVTYSPCISTSVNSRNALLTEASINKAYLSNKSSLNIFPNPGSSLFNAEIKNFSGNIIFTITDIYGRKVKEHNSASGTLVLDMSDSPQGIYLVTATASEKQWVQKIIKE